MLDLRSTNPVLATTDNIRRTAVAGPVATVGGIVNKTAIAISIASVGGLLGAYAVTQASGPMVIGLLIGSFVATIVAYFAILTHPERASWGAPLYALAEGVMLGVLAMYLDNVLKAQGIVSAVGLGVQAFIITLSIAVAMLVVYRMGLIRANRRFVAVLSVLTAGICIAYLAGFVLSFFSVQIPYLSLGSAFAGGKAMWIGLGLNVFILIVASLWLVVDFQAIETATTNGEPRTMEWYYVFALLVTLVWIYMEALKLAFRVAAATNSRN